MSQNAADQPWSMTVTDRTMKYISIITKINMDNRPRIVDTNTGQFWPIATYEDFKETLLLMERAASGVRPYLVNWFNDEFNPTFMDRDGKPNELKGEGGQTIVKERYVGVTTEQLAEKHQLVMGGIKLSSKDILDKYIYPLLNQGVIDKVPSEIDKRYNIFFPVDATPGGSNIFALFQDPDDIRLKVPDQNDYPTIIVIEDSIRSSLEYSSEDGVGNGQKYKILDVDGKEITPHQLAEKYFSSPENCFIKDEETLKVEKEVVQNILHRVTPPSWNNIPSEIHNNPIEANETNGTSCVDKNSTSDKCATSDDSSRIVADRTNLETSRLKLRYSTAAQVLTNDSIEDVDDDLDTDNKSGGE